MGSRSSHRGPTSGTWLPAALALCVFCAGGTPAAARADAPGERGRARLDSTVRYLQDTQQPDGGFADPGTRSSPGTSAWVALALAAAGINPRDQKRPGGNDAYRYLDAHFRDGADGQLPCSALPTTDFERVLLVIDAAGTDPHSFAGCDPTAEILARRLPDGSFAYLPGEPGSVNTTIFAVLALSPVREPIAQEAIRRAVDWLIDAQGKSGGWGWGAPGAVPITDMTGAALEALAAAGRTGGEVAAAQAKALEYLREAQGPDGGFPEVPDRESNSASTAWVVQGLWAVGQDPEAWLTASGEEPLDYLESMQQPDGHIRWKRSADDNGVWMTAYAAPAFAGQPLPIPAVPRAGGEGGPSGSGSTPGATGDGEGVIAGGGGNGAPLFSRPRPGSRGRTPGGVRVVGSGRAARDRASSRHGRNVKQPGGTVRSEPRAGAGGHSAGGDSGGRPPGGSGHASPGGGDEQGREVRGELIGSAESSRAGAFGAPGLHSAGGEEGEGWLALGIAAGAALSALGGAGWEWRRREAPA